MKKALFIIGIILIAASAVWKFAIAPRFDIRFPDNWSWKVTTTGTNLFADDQSGQFPATKKFPVDDDIAVSDREISVSHDNVPAGSIRLKDHYISKDPNSGAVTWEYTYEAVVDPTTGLFIDPKYKNDYFFFPRNVQKDTTYQIRNTSYPGLPMKFQQESTIEGLSVYEFDYLGSFDNTAAYPDTKLKDGQAIKCTNLELRYWVEPTTGEIVKYLEACAGDAVIEVSTNKVINYLSRWSGNTSAASVITIASQVASERTAYFWVSSYLPLILLVSGLLCLGIGVFLSRRSSTQVTQNSAA